MKKGLTNFEFVLAVFVFLTTITFISVTIISKVPNLRQDSMSEGAKARSYYVSQLLLFDEGSPQTWTWNNVGRIGLSDGSRYKINMTKINELSILCTQQNRERLRSLVGDIIINITTKNGTPVMYCQTFRPQIGFRVRRVGFNATDFLVMDVLAV